MMNRFLQHILSARRAALLPAVLLALSAGCNKEAAPAMDKATVQMTFTTQATAAGANDGSLTEGEHMRTLRIIMANTQTTDILYNVYYDDLDDALTEKTVTFNDIPADIENGTEYDFYAIANEEAFLSEGENLEGKNVNLGVLEERIISNDFNASLTNSLPQAAKETFRIEAKEGIQDYTIPLVFPVAKVCLTFENKSGRTQYFGNIGLQEANPGRGYLFPHDAPIGNIPAVSYTDVMLYSYNQSDGSPSNSFSVPAGTESAPGSSQPLVRYLYPGTRNEGYVLTALWLGTEEQPKSLSLKNGNDLLTQIEGGQQLNVIVTLLPGDKQDVELKYSLADWKKEEIDVPFD